MKLDSESIERLGGAIAVLLMTLFAFFFISTLRGCEYRRDYLRCLEAIKSVEQCKDLLK